MHVKLVDFGLAKEVLPNTRSRYRINYAKIKLALFQSKLIFGLVGPVIFHLHQTFKISFFPFKFRFGLVGTMEFMSPEVRLVFSKHKHRQTQCIINNDGKCFRWSPIKRPGLPAICGASGYVVRVV